MSAIAGTLRRIAGGAPLPTPPGRFPPRLTLAALAAALFATCVAALSIGAYRIPPAAILDIALHALGLGAESGFQPQQAAVLAAIRAPRVALAAIVGAGLALAGAAMQGLFRNPLADPGLIGVSGGAALAAAAVIVMGAVWIPGIARALGAFTLPLAAFLGSLATATVIYRVASSRGHTSVAILLLAGIAVNALVFAGIGVFTHLANDEQLRSLTFWQLGSVAGASWPIVGAVGSLVALAGLGLARQTGPLNALALGEGPAGHLGIDVQRLKVTVVALVALAVGAVVAVSGVILFVGLVAPHMVRLACGPDHRVVLPGAALLGALLLVAADLGARTVIAPAELPIGVLTAFIGAPLFIALLLRSRREWAI